MYREWYGLILSCQYAKNCFKIPVFFESILDLLTLFIKFKPDIQVAPLAGRCCITLNLYYYEENSF